MAPTKACFAALCSVLGFVVVSVCQNALPVQKATLGGAQLPHLEPCPFFLKPADLVLLVQLQEHLGLLKPFTETAGIVCLCFCLLLRALIASQPS